MIDKCIFSNDTNNKNLQKILNYLVLLFILFFTPSSVKAAFNPVLTNILLNNGNNINLTAGSTVGVNATAVITDQDGYADINTVISKIYRSGVTNGQNCTTDINNCYSVICSLSGCAGNSCNVTCPVSLYFSADPTASGRYIDEYWSVYLAATDKTSGSTNGFSASGSPDINSTIPINSLTSAINHGLINPGSNTGAMNQSITITNIGNTASTIQLYGTDACTDYPTCTGTAIDKIAPINQKYSRSTFTYPSGNTLTNTFNSYILNLAKPTQSPSNASGNLYWGMGIPSYQLKNIYTGSININSILAVECGFAECNVSADCGALTCNTFYRDSDEDGLGTSSCAVKACGTIAPIGYVNDTSDVNDNQYCPNIGYNVPGTCLKCVNGAYTIQTTIEDLFSECTIGANGSSTSCQANNCSGTSNSCGILTTGSVCRISAGVCDVADTCSGTVFACSADAFQPTSYNISGSTTCQECSGTAAAPINQASNEDLWAQCAIGTNGSATSCQSNNCSGTSNSCGILTAGTACRTSAGLCDVADTCSGTVFACSADTFQPTSYNISSSTTCQKCTGTAATQVNQISSEDLWAQCTTGANGSVTSCQSNNCIGTANSCGILAIGNVCRTSAGVCDVADTCVGNVFTCSADSKLSGKQSCITCTQCDGANNTCQNITAGLDPNNDCGAYSCSSYLWGWNSLSCTVASNTASNGVCNGAAACYSGFTTLCLMGGQSGTGICGSAGCLKSCAQQATPTSSFDTPAEVCYTDSAQHSCSAGYVCNASGTCSQPCTYPTCYQDADSDGYGNPSVPNATGCTSCISGYVANNTDCCDTSALANPGGTYQTTAIPAGCPKSGTYDYNCNGVDEKHVAGCVDNALFGTAAAKYCKTPTCVYWPIAYAYVGGMDGSVACGGAGSYRSDASFCTIYSSCAGGTTPWVQKLTACTQDCK